MKKRFLTIFCEKEREISSVIFITNDLILGTLNTALKKILLRPVAHCTLDITFLLVAVQLYSIN